MDEKLKRKLTVHIVDDDVFSMEVLGDFLKKKRGENLEVFNFETGEDCIAKILEKEPDLVILDYHLDSKDKSAANGIEILKRINKHHPNVKVIMLSGQAKIDVAIECMRFGAIDYVVKGETASLHVSQIILAIIKSENQTLELKAYKMGFWIATSIMAVLTTAAIILYAFFPEHTRHLPF